MAKITKAKGLTVSQARTGGTRVAGIVAAVAEPETAEVVATHIEVPTGSVKSVVTWIGSDPDRAAAAAESPRKGIRDAAARVLGDG